MRHIMKVSALLAAACLTVGLAAPAQALLAEPSASSAGRTAPQLVVRSLALERGAATLTARLQCSGGGFMKWNVTVQQGKRASEVNRRYRCNGEVAWRQLSLVPERGRFRPGPAILSFGVVLPCTSNVCLGWGQFREVALTHVR